MVSKECEDKGLAFLGILRFIDDAFDAAITFKPDYNLARFYLGESRADLRKSLERNDVAENEANEIGGLISEVEKVLGTAAQGDALMKLRERTVDLMFEVVVACECKKKP